MMLSTADHLNFPNMESPSLESDTTEGFERISLQRCLYLLPHLGQFKTDKDLP